MSLKSNIVYELKKGPRSINQLRDRTGATRKQISKVLGRLVDDRRVKAERGVYTLAEKKPAEGIPSKLVKLGRRFGFASALDASGDIFIPGHSLMGAMPGDEVCVQLFEHPRVAGSREGEVTEILKPNNRLVGELALQNGRLVLVPDASPDNPIPVKQSRDMGGRAGDKVAGEIISRGTRHSEHRVRVTLRFGDADSAKDNVKAILYAQGIEKSFPEEVKANAKSVAAGTITDEEISLRKDLRSEAVLTIDSDSTKDIDDAVSIKKSRNGYKVGVHIADVSHYVVPGSPLDDEALKRATSIYYADSVVPMLPKALSNGICSLNPQEDRLAFSCIMHLDTDARLIDYKFQKTVIRSRVKGVYSEINALLGGAEEEALTAKYAEVEKALPLLQEVYGKLALLREGRGSLELESDEAKLVLDEKGRCVAVEKRERGVSERIIEELMLLANSCAANLARRKDIPFVYRVHDKPSADRIDALKTTIEALGIAFKVKDAVPTQKEYAKLLDDTRGTPLARPVHNGVLRSMAKAKYEPVPKGHYGLALDDYAHFTSPIRRYPDLAIHRILSDLVAGASDKTLVQRYTDYAARASAESTERELVAQSVERSCDACYKAEFMQAHIGEILEGVISSVQSFGIYVELGNTVEGMVHASVLSEHPLTLVDGICLADSVSGKAFRLGDTIRVRVAGVDIAQGNVDFVLV